MSYPEWEVINEDGTQKQEDTYPVTLVLSTKKPVKVSTFGILRPNSPVQWLFASAVPVLDSEGGISQVVLTFMDITKRIQAEKALKALASNFSALYGEELFFNVSRHLATTLDIDYAFIGELNESEDGVIVIAGLTHNGDLI